MTTANAVASRALPSPKWGDNIEGPPRMGPYRELYLQTVTPNMGVLCDEGSYFVGTNATPGTAVNYAIQTTFSDTVSAITLRNSDGAGGKRITLDYIRLLLGTVPASATAGQFAIKTDATVRGSAGTLVIPQNPNADVGQGSVADLRYTPTVAVASAAARLLSRGALRSTIPVINDEWMFVFGSVEKSAAAGLGAATAQRMPIPVPPVIVGPGQTVLLHLWFPGNAATAAAFEWECGWWER